MSYSFTVVAGSKDEAGVKTEAELQRVVEAQSIYEIDRQAAQDAIEAFVDVLADPDDNQEIHVSVSGSLSWRDDKHIVGASVNVYATLQTKT